MLEIGVIGHCIHFTKFDLSHLLLQHIFKVIQKKAFFLQNIFNSGQSFLRVQLLSIISLFEQLIVESEYVVYFLQLFIQSFQIIFHNWYHDFVVVVVVVLELLLLGLEGRDEVSKFCEFNLVIEIQGLGLSQVVSVLVSDSQHDDQGDYLKNRKFLFVWG